MRKRRGFVVAVASVLTALPGGVIAAVPAQAERPAANGTNSITLGIVSCENRTLTVSVDYRNSTNKSVKLDVL